MQLKKIQLSQVKLEIAMKTNKTQLQPRKTQKKWKNPVKPGVKLENPLKTRFHQWNVVRPNKKK